ncbi:MAG TPA: sigma factor-like helix-turn-helix DNA-binding protein [Streptosporangiaceae bacterium]|nr:sigma factor-like helix-turn-helix DNA-binding protein [Streptosporangiaceae bacterium]
MLSVSVPRLAANDPAGQGRRSLGPGPAAPARRRSRVAVYLADVAGLRYREISDLTGIPVGTLKSCLHRGRGRLRGALTAGPPARAAR